MKIYVVVETCPKLNWWFRYIATFEKKEKAKEYIKLRNQTIMIEGDEYEIFETETI